MVFSEGPLSLVSTGPLLALPLDRRQPLGRQIEGRLRELIRSEGLPLGAELPSTRALAADLGVSRGVVVGAYAQLAAEG
jgi:GntR family transcriptional regulator/MocR family aminotransferase